MGTWLNPVDIYCERLDASFWSEPINAITNLAFIIAGWLIWRMRSPRSGLMAILLILIGLGSFSFHTFANRLTSLLDVLAIALYLVSFAYLIPKQWSWGSRWTQIGSVITLFILIVLCQLAINYMKPALPWMPSGMYVGAWSALLLYAVLTQNSNPIAARYLWFAVLVFPFSLLSRQLDMPLCESGFSTHWLWHVLNG
ncbi:MAG: hypothetical protein EBW85_04655, partial [Burkholderiaceae bacterium]|nr:hypothetical protein [Burkholderiaceae bacterium]